MKIALCFYGLVGGAEGNDGKGFTLSPLTAAHYYKKNIIDNNENVDIFIHSWSVEEKKELIEIYKPKRYSIEIQKKFYPWKLFLRQFLHPLPILKLFLSGNWNIFSWIYSLSTRAQSRWYSNKKAIQLALEYQKSNGFNYDFIFVTRMDVVFFEKINFNNFDKNYFYVPNRNKGPNITSVYNWESNRDIVDDAFGDLFFFSNSRNMKEFSLLFDSMLKYSLRPPFAAKQHINKITNKIKKIFFYGQDYHVLRMFFFKDEHKDIM